MQVIELGCVYNGHQYQGSFQFPDNVYGVHNCLELNTLYGFPEGKEFPNLTGIYATLFEECDRFFPFMKDGSFPSLKVLISDGRFLNEAMTTAIANSCPALRFLQIDASDLYVDCHGYLKGLLKRLFVLVVHCFRHKQIYDSHLSILDSGLFPADCELRALTIVFSGPFHNISVCLEKLLRNKNTCLPKLERLNLAMLSQEDIASEMGWIDEMKRQFRQKSVDFVVYFACDQILLN